MKRILAALAVAVLVLAAGLWWGLAPLVAWWTADSLAPDTGTLALPGLAAPVVVRRDDLGVPVVEAQDLDDLAYATGWVMAADRYYQMVTLSLTAQGRLSEMAGPSTVGIDRYMRTLGLRRAAAAHAEKLSPELQRLLERFAGGVNAWRDQHLDRLPAGLRLAGYVPEPWTPLNSMDVYVLLNLGLSLNLHEELAFLNLAQRVGSGKAAWLLPVYPDEPLPFAEAAKLGEAAGGALAQDADALARLNDRLGRALAAAGVAASNNWAIAPARTRNGASILANDTHLMLTHPPSWMLLQLRTPQLSATGIAIAGIPGIVAGYNGKVAWGMTMVMADTQDLFVERLRDNGGVTEYQVGDAWHPVDVRRETILVKGGEPVVFDVRSTRHGPLVNDAVRDKPINPVQPYPLAPGADNDLGLALRWSVTEPDESMAAMLSIATAGSFGEAQAAIRGVRYIHLNMLWADRDNIGWQVTGRYPRRGCGSGKFPSPGWVPACDWQGWHAVEEQPSLVNPPAGYIGTANDRKVPADYPVRLSSSWFYPERGERIEALLAARSDHDAAGSTAMHNDQVNPMAPKLQRVLASLPLADAIARLPQDARAAAQEAYVRLSAWDGDMRATSADAALYALFEEALMRELFADELGPADSPAWMGLRAAGVVTYSATQDHLLQRDDSPFWDDVRSTGTRETKADILARALAAAVAGAEARMGADRARWQWGRIHTYTWRSPQTEAAASLPEPAATLVGRLAPLLDAGPFPAGGNQHTLNVAGWTPGGDGFATEIVPAMRLVVDFSAAEPVQLVIAGGQSDNPVSPHYTDGIAPWLAGTNRPMPFHDAALRERQYHRVLTLQPAAGAPAP